MTDGEEALVSLPFARLRAGVGGAEVGQAGDFACAYPITALQHGGFGFRQHLRLLELRRGHRFGRNQGLHDQFDGLFGCARHACGEVLPEHFQRTDVDIQLLGAVGVHFDDDAGLRLGSTLGFLQACQ
ncbi:hypothetical protein D3C76_1308220 [compost metagenome]